MFTAVLDTVVDIVCFCLVSFGLVGLCWFTWVVVVCCEVSFELFVIVSLGLLCCVVLWIIFVLLLTFLWFCLGYVAVF